MSAKQKSTKAVVVNSSGDGKLPKPAEQSSEKSSTKSGVTIVKSSGGSKVSHWLRHYWILLFLILVAITTGIVLYAKLNRKTTTIIATNACSSNAAGSIMQEAAGAFDPSQSQQLAAVVAKVKALPYYKHDPNCMYILTRYYLNIYNISAAQSSLNQLQNDDTANLNAQLVGTVDTYQLVSQLHDEKQQLQQNQSNASYSTLPNYSPQKSKK